MVVVGGDAVVERAPIVDLWLRAARRNGARVLEVAGPELDAPLADEMRAADRAVLIWSGPHGEGGMRVAALAAALGLHGREGSGAFYLPQTPNARGVCEAWAAADDADETDPHPIGLLIVSGDEAAADPAVRALAEHAEAVIAITLFQGLAVGWADLVLPGTSNLERDGTLINLEGRLQRLRRTVLPPVPDELAWLSKLACRFDVQLSPHAPVVFEEISEKAFGGISFGAMGERAPLPAPTPIEDLPALEPAQVSVTAPLRLHRYRPLFSGAAVERTPELQFQRPAAEVELARADAESRGIRPGRRGRRLLERHLGHAARAPLAHAAARNRADRRGARGRAASRGRGEAGMTPETWWVGLIEALIVPNLLLLAFAYTTWFERKLLSRMQLRYGPNRAGKFGLVQPFADMVKLLYKEAFAPSDAIRTPYIIAPIVSAFTAILAFSVIPFGPGWTIDGYTVQGVVADVPIALILVFALGSIGVYGFIVGGWASDSKYSLLGSMRTCAQLVSYEVSIALAVLGVVMMGQSLSLVDIVAKQSSTIWFVIPQLVGFAVFIVAGVAETNRAPFDLPEAETELVAGYHTEYSGMRWGLFQMAEYINMIVLSALAVTLFFGGYHGPWLPGPLWFLIKLALFVTLFIWIRASLPRLRYDQLMRLGWKVLLPVATINAVITALLVVWI